MSMLPMMPKYAAMTLLKDWGDAERGEVSQLDYPSVSPTFKDYQSGYRSTGVMTERDMVVEMTGTAVNKLHPALRKTLRLIYIDRAKKIPRRARDMAIEAFRKEFDSLPKDSGY